MASPALFTSLLNLPFEKPPIRQSLSSFPVQERTRKLALSFGKK